MADAKCSCSCTCGSDNCDGPDTFIFPCAGQSNVGQLSNAAAIRLTDEGYGNIKCTALMAADNEGVVKSTLSADKRLIIDGCSMACASKIMKKRGIPIEKHVIVTELGIKKSNDRYLSENEIETVVSSVWEGN